MTEINNQCGKCQEALFDKINIACVFCSKFFHKRCSKLDDNVFKCVISNTDVFWRCSGCSSSLARNICSEIAKLSLEITSLKNEFQKCVKDAELCTNPSAQQNDTTTNVLAANKWLTSSSQLSPTVVIKPSNAANVAFTRVQRPFSSSATSAAKQSNSSGDSSAAKGNAVAQGQGPSLFSPDADDHSPVSPGGDCMDPNGNHSLHNNWTTVEHKKRRPKKVMGTSTSSDISAVYKYKWLHISRCHPDTSEDNIINHVAKKLCLPADSLRCRSLIKKDVDKSNLRFITFKLGVPEQVFTKLFDGDIWPSGIVVRRFVNTQKNGTTLNVDTLKT